MLLTVEEGWQGVARWSWVMVKHSKAESTRERHCKLSAGTQQLGRHYVKISVPRTWNTRLKGKVRRTEMCRYVWRGAWRRSTTGNLFGRLGQLYKTEVWDAQCPKKGCRNLCSNCNLAGSHRNCELWPSKSSALAGFWEFWYSSQRDWDIKLLKRTKPYEKYEKGSQIHDGLMAPGPSSANTISSAAA